MRTEDATRWHGREAELAASGERWADRPVWVGQVAGLVRAQLPAAEVVAELAGAEKLLRAWSSS